MNSSDQRHLQASPSVTPLLWVCGLAACSLLAFLLLFHTWMKDFYQQVDIQRRQNLMQLVSVARHTIEPLLAQVRAGALSPAEARTRVRDLVRTMTYTDQYGKNYIFMSAYNGTMLVQPFEPAKELTDQWDLQDARGLFIIRELVQAARTHPDGAFVSYHYHLPGVHGTQEKLAFVRGIPELQAYIGTGMYLQQPTREQEAILRRTKYGAVGLVILILVPLIVAARAVIQRNRLLYAEIQTRQQAEEERLEMQRQLLHSQKLESLGIMAGGIAHDFNNLTMAILGNLDLALLELPPAASARHYIEQSMQASRRAADLTRQMLAYSGKGRFVIQDINLSDLVRENVHLFQAAMAKTVSLKLDLDERLQPLQGDPGQVQQVIMNLITNATEAIGDHPGEISLATGLQECDTACLQHSRLEDNPPPGLFAYVEVGDTGCGMADDTLARLFDPFFTTKFTGRGLGMAAVLGIVRGHGGAIFVDSGPERGTLIRVLFPVTAGVNATDASPPPVRPPSPVPGELPPPGAVLVVDDEPAVLQVCHAILERLGFRVLTARDGREAVDTFQAHAGQIACVIMDLTMPNLDGVSAFHQLRRLQPDVKVILSSGYNEQEVTQRFAGQGLAGFIQKPYQIKNLREELQRVLAREIVVPPGTPKPGPADSSRAATARSLSARKP